MRKRWSILFAFLLGLGIAPHAMALSPEVRTDGGIPYLSGGIGLDEREALDFVSQDYNLKLIFAMADGNYLSDVEVQIKDQEGKTVLAATSQGPWFFAKLPPETYHVYATTPGRSQEKVSQAPSAGQTRISFAFSSGDSPSTTASRPDSSSQW